jgi:hypothetical protein
MTILDEVKPLRNGTPISESVQARIQSKLITLFHQLCHVYEENISYEFEDIVASIHTINTMFKYAVVELIIKEDHIEVVFYLRQAYMKKIPAESQVLVIITDEDMNYKFATFKSSFFLGTPNQKGTLSIERVVDRYFGVTTSLSYAISAYGLDSYKFNLKYEHLPKIYLSNDNNFYTPFLKMIEYCFNQPEIFYSVFDEYPSHKDMLSDDYAFKNFLRNYNNDYKSRKKLLKSKMVLLDMQAI